MNLKQHLISKAAQAHGEERLASDLVQGRAVRIIADWRDQPYGWSKKNLKGTKQIVRACQFDHGDVHLWLEGLRCSINIDDVEFT